MQFIWVGSVYVMGSTALVPLSGGLTQDRIPLARKIT